MTGAQSMDSFEFAPTVLLVTAVTGAEHLAAAVSERAGVVIELVRTRRAGLASLRRYSFDALIVDSSLPEGEATPTELLWQNLGGALPLEIDLQALGAAAVGRMLHGMLVRRDELEIHVRDQITRTLAEEIRGPITGLLLQSDLVLRERELAPAVEERIRAMRSLAEDLRLRLRQA